MHKLSWKIVATTGTAALTIAAVAGFAGVAGAEPTAKSSTTYVDGFDAVTDDFNDHFRELGAPLSDHGENSWGTDTVLLWQSILGAEGFLEADDIDGYFGKDTAAATAKWQAEHGADGDAAGTVGHTTWSLADNNLVDEDDTVYYETVEGGQVLFERKDSPDDGYKLLRVITKSQDSLINDSDAEHIEHFKKTIELAPEKS